jgi:hypothetical protein
VIVVLDACVLYPPSLRDLLLTLAALDAFDVRRSDEILDEVTRNVLADHPDIDKSRFVAHTIGAMRRAFPEARVQAPAELVEKLDNDPKDRHIGATALAAGSTIDGLCRRHSACSPAERSRPDGRALRRASRDRRRATSASDRAHSL